jgi:hypothetical protein
MIIPLMAIGRAEDYPVAHCAILLAMMQQKRELFSEALLNKSPFRAAHS